MQRNKRLVSLLVVLMLCAAAIVPIVKSQAQAATVTITVAVPTNSADAYSDQMISQFESSHPGITIKIVKNDTNVPSETNGLDAHYAALQTYVTAADVLLIDSRRLAISEVDTRAGFFLDMAPLVNQDTTLNVDDFFPSIWQSYQWDKGIWALPSAADAVIMSYNSAAFDDAKLAYPTDKWTLDDIVTNGAKLVQKDSSGAVVKAGISVFPQSSLGALFRSLLGEGLFDNTVVPNVAKIDKPALEAMLDNWYTNVDQAGIAASGGGGFQASQSAAIGIGPASQLLFPRPGNSNDKPPVPMLLPGGKAVLNVQGYAVSGGTQYPEQAYAVAAFLTTRAELANRGTISPARKSLVGTQNSQNNQGPGFRRNITPEMQAVIDQAIANGLGPAEMRYTNYINIALNQMRQNKLAAKDALQAVEATAIQNEQAADAKKTTAAVTVATPIPQANLAPGKVALKFGVSSFVNPLPNQEKWQKVIQDFVASDPQVGDITLDGQPGFGGNINTFTDRYDCFYLPFNAVPNTSLGLLLSIDSFLSADTTFDKNDVVGNIMAQLSRDNKVWAFPIIIEPGVLQYNATQFQKANLPLPGANWSIDAFRDAIQALKPNDTDPAPFVASNANGTHLLILMAAYGGLPLDYRTSPPTINFTDQKTVDAIKQVLDIAKAGYIKYDALGTINFGGNRLDRSVPIYTDALNAFNFRGPAPATTSSSTTYKPTGYPVGKEYSAVTYSIGTAYISAKSQNPEACYRFMSTVSRHPELFSAMPARLSLVTDPTIAANQGPDLTALYSQLGNQLKNPNTISIPALFGGGANPTGFLLPHWLYEAFDTYVLNNGDLDAALKDAEGYAKGFVQCTADIPPFDPATQNLRDYNQQYATCATKVDPKIKTLFGG